MPGRQSRRQGNPVGGEQARPAPAPPARRRPPPGHGDALAKLLLPTLSSLALLPAVSIAAKRRFHMEAMVYLFTTFFVALYHACHGPGLSVLCFMRQDVLEYFSVYGTALSMWVSLMALADFDEPKRSTFVMFGVLTIAVRIYHDRWGYGVYSGPIGTAVLIIAAKWLQQMKEKKALYPDRSVYYPADRPRPLLWGPGPDAALLLRELASEMQGVGGGGGKESLSFDAKGPARAHGSDPHALGFGGREDQHGLDSEGRADWDYTYVHSFYHCALAMSFTLLLPKVNKKAGSPGPPAKLDCSTLCCACI
ncbi:hypothetical protein QTO34_005000 [Cnephaeus nilssonii]|uniref:Protein myomaker n=1 Tax=Cnephaeus nilssonii TaxID=3371016 RepID=A0AA40HNF7_CNENI|nr:hypothetical protein QTO34_005000 [Eptesicus nilssonii]